MDFQTKESQASMGQRNLLSQAFSGNGTETPSLQEICFQFHHTFLPGYTGVPVPGHWHGYSTKAF